MYFGADYYPEHWPKERWPVDARLMREANLNIVRLAEFSWAKLEPEKGRYDFGWLDEAIDTLAKEGIRVVLGTPTATPPKWLCDQYPDIFQKDEYGRLRGFGSRRHYCYNNPTYQALTRDIVKIMAEHYKGHPSVVAWQIDNEFGCHDTTYCYCEHCLDAFKKWLQRKYGTIENLNKEWGTIFWSQTYGSWDELILPTYTVCEDSDPRSHGLNPGLLLDFCRFSSDSTIAYQKLQIDEIRNFSSAPITTNLMGHFPEIDYFKEGKDLDFISWDNYPAMQWGKSNYKHIAMAHDLMRGLKDKNFWVMEQQSGPCGWSVFGDTPRPGQIRLWTHQAVAHGADAIVYFRWRACTFGAEEYWYGILDHDAVPRRRYREVQQTGAELKTLSDLVVGSRNVSDVAVIKSYDNLWSHKFHSHNPGFDYNQLLASYYDALISNNITSDITTEMSDFGRYKAVFMPAFNLMNDEIKARVEDYVKQGGTLVITFRSGTRTWNNSMTIKTYPGEFKEIAGVEVEEFDSLNHGRTVSVNGIMGEGTAKVWCDVLKPVSAKILAVYSNEYYRGQPAVTVNSYGKGKVYYIGCDLDPQAMQVLVKEITLEAGVIPLMPWSVDGVEVVKKDKNGRQYLMILNHNAGAVTLEIGGSYRELISGSNIDGILSLPPYGVAVLE